MSSNSYKLNLKRPAESEIIDVDDGGAEKSEDSFRIKTLEEIRQEKRRRLEKEDEPGEERNGSPADNLGVVSPVVLARRDSRPSSKQGSPTAQGTVSEVIYQLSPEQPSLSSSE